MARDSIRFRFVLNRGGGSAQQVSKQARGAVNAVVEDVTARYAEGTYTDVKNQIVHRIRADIMTELSFMAGNFKSSVIGIAGSRKGPNSYSSLANEYSQVSGIAQSMSNSAGVNWPARTARYMDWKQKNYGHSQWFLNKGHTLSALMGKRGTWTAAFGGVDITVSRGGEAGGLSLGKGAALTTRARTTSRAGYRRYQSAGDSHIRHSVLNIKVAALTNITPRMLPALASGQLGSYAPDGRKTGLIGMLPDSVAFRLGGKDPHVKYRHTVEPFLSFVLTQAVPNALFNRVQKGLNAKLSNSVNRRTR